MQRRIKYWNEYKNPFYYWWKVRKLFKYKSKWFIGKYYWTFGDYIKESPVSLRFRGLGWKTKYNDNRFEWSPCIYFKFFKWQIRYVIGPIDECYLYWETILDWFYNDENRTFKQCVNRNTLSGIKENEIYNVYTKNLLTNYGKKLYESV